MPSEMHSCSLAAAAAGEMTGMFCVVFGAVVFISFGASFAAPEAAVPAVAAALAAAWQQMRFIVSMKQAEQQLLQVGQDHAWVKGKEKQHGEVGRHQWGRFLSA